MRSAAPKPFAATGVSCRDRDHRRALQSLVSGQLPRADGDDLGLCQRLDAVLPDGRAAARRVDEPASRRAPGGMALRDGQAGWQGRLAEGGKRGRMSEATSAFRLCLSPHIRFAHAGYLPRVYVAF